MIIMIGTSKYYDNNIQDGLPDIATSIYVNVVIHWKKCIDSSSGGSPYTYHFL